MGVDETGTRTRFRAHLGEVIEPAVGTRGGRIVKTSGDGLLVEFASVVDAVECAVAIQTEMTARNAEVADDRRLEFRIGINLGDVIVEDDDIHGDGVNIAARLEGLAEPGGLCISGGVHEQVRNKLVLAFEDMGEQAVKNIAEPVRAHRLIRETAPAAALALPDKPSIAVLPFDNMSGDAEQEYFSDGITEDIITDLSKVSALFVIARNSSFTYKGRAVDVKQVAADLGVRYVVEGSVRKAGNRVRVTSQLIDGGTGGHLWAERYDRELDDIFEVQDEVTRNIVDALRIQLTPDEAERAGARGAADLEAYDLVLRAREHAFRFTADENREAVRLLDEAIARDPQSSTAHAALALTLSGDYVNAWNGADGETVKRCLRLAERSAELDDRDPQAHWALAVAHMWTRDLDRAVSEAKRTIVLDPNSAMAYAILGNTLGYAGRPAEAVESVERAMRLDPQYPDIYLHFLGHAHVLAGDYETAIEILRRRVLRNPGTDVSRVLLASCHGHLGRLDEARAEWQAALEANPAFSLEQKGSVLPYADPADWRRILDGLARAGLVE
jgi:adenylate cyclase